MGAKYLTTTVMDVTMAVTAIVMDVKALAL